MTPCGNGFAAAYASRLLCASAASCSRSKWNWVLWIGVVISRRRINRTGARSRHLPRYLGYLAGATSPAIKRMKTGPLHAGRQLGRAVALVGEQMRNSGAATDPNGLWLSRSRRADLARGSERIGWEAQRRERERGPDIRQEAIRPHRCGDRGQQAADRSALERAPRGSKLGGRQRDARKAHLSARPETSGDPLCRQVLLVAGAPARGYANVAVASGLNGIEKAQRGHNRADPCPGRKGVCQPELVDQLDVRARGIAHHSDSARARDYRLGAVEVRRAIRLDMGAKHRDAKHQSPGML